MDIHKRGRKPPRRQADWDIMIEHCAELHRRNVLLQERLDAAIAREAAAAVQALARLERTVAEIGT